MWALGIAVAVSARADCTRQQVGAVILDSNRHIVSAGYNGSPPGALECGSQKACPRGQIDRSVRLSADSYSGIGRCIAIHAEDNAIRQAKARGVDLSECTMYSTDLPCAGCKTLIIESGLKRVVSPAEDLGGTMIAKTAYDLEQSNEFLF